MFISTEPCHMYQRNTKSHADKANIKDNVNNTMTGCINTARATSNGYHQKTDETVKVIFIKTNNRTLYHVLRW